MTPEDVRRFFAEVKTLEETYGKLNFLDIGDQNYWFECRDENDREVKYLEQMLPGDGYTIKIFYRYPCDPFLTLFVFDKYSKMMVYLWIDYLRMIRRIRARYPEE